MAENAQEGNKIESTPEMEGGNMTNQSKQTQSSSKSGPLLMMAGGISGVAECVVVQPFDMLKTRFHLNHGQNKGVIASLKDVYTEGGMARFYRGILPEMAGMVPKSSAMFATYGAARDHFIAQSPDGKLSVKHAAMSGLLSGYSEAFTVAPFQVLKVRMQAKEHIGRYKNSFHCAKMLFKHEGLAAFFTGLGPTCWRNCVWNTVYFGSLQYAREHLLPTEETRLTELLQTLFAGTLCGLFATCFNAPFDAVKSRFQSQLPPHLGGKIIYRYTLPSLVSIAKAEGLAAIYKGFVPKAIRMALGGGVAMGVFELICSFSD